MIEDDIKKLIEELKKDKDNFNISKLIVELKDNEKNNVISKFTSQINLEYALHQSILLEGRNFVEQERIRIKCEERKEKLKRIFNI